MKKILSIIISGALVVSGYSQTRNVLVGTNNAVVQPTNFWSADASNARAGLGLGTAATNPSSAFQPSSSVLSNLASGNGSVLTGVAASNIAGTLSVAQGGTGSTNASDARTALGLGTAATNPASAFQASSIVLSNLAISNGAALTNISAANIVGVIPSANLPFFAFTNLSGTLSIAQGGTGATNAANARQNLGSTTVGDALFIATNAASARTALGATTVGGSVFTAIDAAAARTALSLGTASTNPASAFQPSSATLSNLSLGNASGLTNVTASAVSSALAISNTSGLQAALDSKLATNGSAAGLTNFPSIVLQTNSSLSLFPSGLLRANGDGSGLTNLPVPAAASNVLSTISIEKGGTGSTNADGARIALGGTTVGTNLFTAIDAASARTAIGLGTASTSSSGAFQPSSSVLTNLSNNNGGTLTNIVAGNIVGTVGSASNITGVAALASNVSGVVSLVNGGTGGTNAATARSGIGLGTTNTLTIAGLIAQNLTIESGGGIALQAVLTNAASFRTNIGLSWTGLTSVDATSFRSALGLGTAATNVASAFQKSSATLSNIASGDGGSLSNLQATNIVGIIPASNISTVTLSNIGGTLPISQGGTSATNAANARANLGSTIVGDALFIATNASAARLTIGATTVGSSLFTLANPSSITFLRLNADNTASALSASDFRTAIGLGTSATNPSSAFQTFSTNLNNLAGNNGANLTNIPLSGVIGALATNGSAVNLTNFPLSLLLTNGSAAGLTNFPANILKTNGNGSGLTNLSAANINGIVALASNVTGTIAISNGGSGATTAGGARTNLGLGATNNVVFESVQAKEIKEASGIRAFDLENFALTFGTNYIVEWSTNSVQVNRPLVFFGTNVANESRTNLGLGATNNAFSSLSVGQLITNQASASNASSAFGRQITIGSAAENSFAAGFGLTMTNSGQAGGSILLGGMGTMAHWGAFLFNGVPQGGVAATSRGNSTFAVNASNGIYLNGPMYFEGVSSSGNGLLRIGSGGVVARAITNVSTGQVSFLVHDGNPDPSVAWTAFTPAQARTNLGLAWPALTNTNAGTGLVSVNTNGEVVSPTNFWQRAPIQTTVQDFTGITVSQTNNATNARNVYVYSLATNVSGISNTIILPTNVSTFNGDGVTVVHKGTTNTTTVVRQDGSTNNLITLNKFDESVKFIRELGQWDFYHNISFVEPIQFSGTNASANAAESRTNLGLPLAALTNTTVTNFQAAIFTTNSAPTNSANVNGIGFNTAVAWMSVSIVTNGVTNSYRIPLFQ